MTHYRFIEADFLIGEVSEALGSFPPTRLPSPDESQNPFNRSTEAHKRPFH